MNVTCSSETSVLTYQITPSHIPEDRNFIISFVFYVVTIELYINIKWYCPLLCVVPNSKIPACFTFAATHCECFRADIYIYIYIYIYVCVCVCVCVCLCVGGTVAQLVEALHYKPEGCGFDFRWCHWNFSLT